MILKIQSQSDIITNSSSEVFIKYDKKAVDNFKDIIQNLFIAFNIQENIDDIVEFVPIADDVEYAIKHWQEEYNIERLPNDHELSEYIFEKTANSFECGRCISRIFASDLKVRAKYPEYENVAKIIQKLISPFMSAELTC